MKLTMNGEFFTYKNRPLVRSKDTIYYGRMTDPYVVMMQVKTKKTVNGEEVSDLISLQMISTDVTVTPDKMVIKRAEKQGMFQALDVASVWLDRMDRDGAK